ncbi:MAG: DNA-formamidopyrimidine glycosylase family protein [Egibacteraceae bacterium]
MPEGDTIHRAARTLAAALEGERVTAFQTRVAAVRALGPQRLLGQTVERVEARGKHLLIGFDPSQLVLHTHMRMTGSWHLYRSGERWRKPAHRLTVRLDVEDWVAVCFSAPVCELLSAAQIERHPALSSLGPDAVDKRVDLAEARRRLDEREDWTIGEALLDQRVLAGVGNVYKCEVCFLSEVDPWARVETLEGALRDALLATAARLLRRNAGAGDSRRVTTVEGPPGGADRLHVYGRARRPCRRCGNSIRVAPLGEQGRITYWCPTCQGPGPAGP